MLISDMIRVFWLVGLDFFYLTGLTQPSKVRIWCCKKQTQSNKWIDFDWLYLVRLDTETHRDWEISWMSRPRLVKTEIFLGCRDRDSSRLGKSMDVETETSRDWAKYVDTETPSRLSLIPGPGVRHIPNSDDLVTSIKFYILSSCSSSPWLSLCLR